MARLVPYLPLNPLLPRPKGDKDAEGMKKQIPSNFNVGSDPRPEADAFYNNLCKPDQELEETHYCCPKSNK
jgi:hypothetical protein